MSRAALLTFAILGCLLGPTRAQEISAPDLGSDLSAESRSNGIKAPYLFNMRGRHDPFVNPNQWQSSGKKVFDITLLEMKGTLEVSGAKAVLFVRAIDNAVFTLRGLRLFGADGKAIQGVSGRILSNRQVQLRQGEQSLNFSAFRAVKRKF